MLIMYNFSMARCSKALLLLGETIVLARSLNLDREVRIFQDCGIQLKNAQLHAIKTMRTSVVREQVCMMVDTHDVMLREEIRTRTFHSCRILDSQLHTGRNRRRLLKDDALNSQRHPTHDEYWSESRDRPWTAPLYRTDGEKNASDDLHLHSNLGERDFSSTTPDTCSISSISVWPCSRPIAPTTTNTRHPENSCQESSLSLYIKASNLLAQVSFWTLRGGRRYALSPIYTKLN